MESLFIKTNSRSEKNYFPLMYLHEIKRPGENYLVKTILLDDLPIIFFAFSSFGDNFIPHIVGILFLTFSFWCIYDYGYYENDYVAAKYEEDPVLSGNYHNDLNVIKWWQPWIWASIFAFLGVITIKTNLIDIFLPFNDYVDFSMSKILLFFLLWLSFLLTSRGVFFIYNYVNKQTRIWLYPLLQISRYCGFLLLLPINLIGACVILGQVFARSTTYVVYRYASTNNWPKLKDWFIRWLVFATILAIMTCAQSDIWLLFNWQTFVVSSWWLFRCRKQIYQIVDNINPIWSK